MIRLGFLSDLHCELEPAGSRWINAFEPEELDRRIDDALAWFREAEADAIVVLGDVVQFADPLALAHAFDRLAASASAPLGAVNGNHDLRIAAEFEELARATGIRLLWEEPLTLDGVTVAGYELGRREPGLPFYTARYAEPPGAGMLVVASHFPLLSEAERVASRGIPYAGDLVNRGEVAGLVTEAGRPTVVLSGHIHARCARADGPILQYTVGALIEPPFECTLLELDPSAGVARRTARRLGDVAPVDPVFAPDDESWAWAAGTWEVDDS